jgi:hypothetical protein
MTLLQWNRVWDQATIRLKYEEPYGTYVAADPISEDRLRDLIVCKRFDQTNYDGVLRLASQAGYCLETEQEELHNGTVR